MVAFIVFDTRRRMRRERVFKDHTNPMETMNDEYMYENFRFHRQHIILLYDAVEMDLDCVYKRKGWVPPVLQVLVALRFYATGTFHSLVGQTFGISSATNHRIVHRVTEAFLKHANFKLPARGRESGMVQDSFARKAGFPRVVGCIDYTHVKILAPSENEHEYVNRKMNHSINVQAVCDANMKITNLVSKWPGSVHDARILRKSALFRQFEDTNQRPSNGVILGERGYPLREWLMTPVLNPRNAAEEAYNVAHRITRCTLERVFGVVKRRWSCLHTQLRMTPERACKVIYAVFWLHNLAVDAGFDMEEDVVNPANNDEPEQATNHAEDASERHRLAAGKAARLDLIQRAFTH